MKWSPLQAGLSESRTYVQAGVHVKTDANGHCLTGRERGDVSPHATHVPKQVIQCLLPYREKEDMYRRVPIHCTPEQIMTNARLYKCTSLQTPTEQILKTQHNMQARSTLLIH
jgi:hypothetical protein